MVMKTKKKGIETLLPTCFNLTLKNPSEEQAREAIKKYDGNIVMLKDTHISGLDYQYYLGTIRTIPKDFKCYSFQRIQEKKLTKLHYHDLDGLMTPSANTFQNTLLKARIYL